MCKMIQYCSYSVQYLSGMPLKDLTQYLVCRILLKLTTCLQYLNQSYEKEDPWLLFVDDFSMFSFATLFFFSPQVICLHFCSLSCQTQVMFHFLNCGQLRGESLVSHFVQGLVYTQVGLKVTILLLQSPQCWNYRHALCPAFQFFFLKQGM